MSDIYLTAKEYLELLIKMRKHLNSVNYIKAEDSVAPGNKYTETNVGLCNDLFTTKETALFPSEFEKGRVSRKYLKDNHPCPIDKRENGGVNGCFYTCRIFQATKKEPAPSFTEIKQLYDEKILILRKRLNETNH